MCTFGGVVGARQVTQSFMVLIPCENREDAGGVGVRATNVVPDKLKERKRTERTERSFENNVKERKERNVLLKRM